MATCTATVVTVSTSVPNVTVAVAIVLRTVWAALGPPVRLRETSSWS